MEQTNNIIQYPFIKIVDDKFILYSHGGLGNKPVVLEKGEAALLYIELHKFLFNNKEN